MSKVKLFKQSKEGKIQCLACNNYCVISEGKTGICKVRQNINNELKLLVNNKAIAVNLDSIEKKPLFHFLPGSTAFSLGTLGCNFACEFCQNWDISQAYKIPVCAGRQETNYWGEDWPPEKIVKYCQENNINIIAYTYNEPTVWAEYALTTMQLAKKSNIKNVWVSNGYMSEETLKLIGPYLDAINVDLKSFQEDFYQKIVHAKLESVKENIKKIWKMGIWEEVTTLIIPDLNDSKDELINIAKFLFNISSDLPWHISAFFPSYKILDKKSTSKETLIKAYNIGKMVGLKYVYTGNIPDNNYESTYCYKCGIKIVERWGIEMIKNTLKNGKCPQCGEKIIGRWV
ncbi:MAG: AmmeMemoRadiSam system radical SAM enzyme [Candidatus Paceibacterota bacterium]|jgi:pyruvate formate lyase activating enzyme